MMMSVYLVISCVCLNLFRNVLTQKSPWNFLLSKGVLTT